MNLDDYTRDIAGLPIVSRDGPAPACQPCHDKHLAQKLLEYSIHRSDTARGWICTGCGRLIALYEDRDLRPHRQAVRALEVAPPFDPLRVALYIAEEVRRQGHDLLSANGLDRVSYMTQAWAFAMRKLAIHAHPPPQWVLFTPGFIESLGTTIEPDKNARGFRAVPVSVGGQRKADPTVVADRMARWCVEANKVMAICAECRRRLNAVADPRLPAPDDDGCPNACANRVPRPLMDKWALYRAFEEVHPFVDGNGRTGKILLNMLGDTMTNPCSRRRTSGAGRSKTHEALCDVTCGTEILEEFETREVNGRLVNVLTGRLVCAYCPTPVVRNDHDGRRENP